MTVHPSDEAPNVPLVRERGTGAVGRGLMAAVRVLALGLGLAVTLLACGAQSLADGTSSPPGTAQPTGPSATASPPPDVLPTPDAELVNVLPTPTTVDVALLVGSHVALTPAEQQWLDELRGSLGKVDAVAYRDATLERLRAYFVIVVTDQNSELDPSALAEAWRLGLTIHLVGPAAAYQGVISPGATP